MKKFLLFLLVLIIALVVASQFLLPSFIGSRIESQLNETLKPTAQTVNVEAQPAFKILYGEVDRVYGTLENIKLGKLNFASFRYDAKQILVNPNNQLQLPKAFSSEGFMANDSTLDDGFVVQIYLSIIQAKNISQIPNNRNENRRIEWNEIVCFYYLEFLPRNPYFVCRAFWNEEPITSVVCWGSSSPRFNFEQVC